MTDVDLDAAVLSDAEPDSDAEPTRTRKERSDKGQSRGGGTGSRAPRASTKKQIVADLLVPYATLAAGASMTAPTLSAVMLARGEATMDAIVSIAGDHPRMMKALKTASKMGPYAEIAQTAFMVMLAAGMDFGRIPPEHPMAMSTGMTQLYMDVHPEVVPDVQSGPQNGFQPMPVDHQWVPGPIAGMPAR